MSIAIEIGFVTAAEPYDEVVETGAPADVFVEPRAAALLEDRVLDAEIEPDGAISFSLHAQLSGPDGAGPNGASPAMG